MVVPIEIRTFFGKKVNGNTKPPAQNFGIVNMYPKNELSTITPCVKIL